MLPQLTEPSVHPHYYLQGLILLKLGVVYRLSIIDYWMVNGERVLVFLLPLTYYLLAVAELRWDNLRAISNSIIITNSKIHIRNLRNRNRNRNRNLWLIKQRPILSRRWFLLWVPGPWCQRSHGLSWLYDRDDRCRRTECKRRLYLRKSALSKRFLRH